MFYRLMPACGLPHRTTLLDLILSRLLADEHIGKKELAFPGHGGLCMDCLECVYPHCPFGKREVAAVPWWKNFHSCF